MRTENVRLHGVHTHHHAPAHRLLVTFRHRFGLHHAVDTLRHLGRLKTTPRGRAIEALRLQTEIYHLATGTSLIKTEATQVETGSLIPLGKPHAPGANPPRLKAATPLARSTAHRQQSTRRRLIGNPHLGSRVPAPLLLRAIECRFCMPLRNLAAGAAGPHTRASPAASHASPHTREMSRLHTVTATRRLSGAATNPTAATAGAGAAMAAAPLVAAPSTLALPPFRAAPRTTATSRRLLRPRAAAKPASAKPAAGAAGAAKAPAAGASARRGSTRRAARRSGRTTARRRRTRARRSSTRQRTT
jgi:hypothetical protein